jgi:Wiskott-Aldrich syndrome protein
MRFSATVGRAPVAQAEIPRDNETSSIQIRGMYPEVERVNVPRRSFTHLGHGPFGHQESLTNRAIARITKKLTDMGFSENAYPTLQEKIKAEMPSSGTTISKEAEDDVVTTLLEELLAPTSSRPNVASGSGQRDVDMGEEAWH